MDLIRRQDAIDAIHCNITVTGRQNAELVAATIGTFVNRIKALPSALSDVPDTNVGKWIPHPEFQKYDVCSVCGIGCKRREYGVQDGHEWMSEESYRFCPHCGAKMEVMSDVG